MNRFLYRLMYWLGESRWDTDITPSEVNDAFQMGAIPPGPVLDLGCGTGTNVIFMAKQKRQAIGIDFVPKAIAKARDKARRAGVVEYTQFHVGDVTHLNELSLPQCSFALDMGCFHGLSLDGQHCYAEELAAILIPGGRYMLYTLDPRKQAGVSFGMLPESVKKVFADWFDIVRIERGTFWDSGSTWFWMERKQ